MPHPAGGAVPPGPPALPLVGHVPAFARDKLGFLARSAAGYGDVVRLRIGGSTYLLTNPDDIKHVLVSNAENYEKTTRLTAPRARRFFGSGLVTAIGTEHLRQRRMLQPAFHREVIGRFSLIIADCVDAVLRGWSDGEIVDVHDAMLDVTQRITARALLGEESQAVLDRFRTATSTRRRYQEQLLGMAFPFIDRLPTRSGRAYARAHRELDRITTDGIIRRRASATRSDDLLSMLVRARYDDGHGMSDDQLRDEVRTLSVAAYETIAEALTWVWYLLAGNPDAEAAVWTEVDGSAARDSVTGVVKPTSLPWCRMVLAETMRLYPPTWLFVRVAQRDDALPSGAAVPSGTKIYLSQWVMHRDARYFADPERFDPRRFTADAILARPRFTYFPFGAGRRLCIGEEFAWTQGVSILAAVARRFRLVLAPGQQIVPEPNLTLRPRGGLRVRLVGR